MIEVRPLATSEIPLALGLLCAQLEEHDLPADAERVQAGLDLALQPGSPAWIRLAWRDGQAVGILLGNAIVSVEQGGRCLWIEELYVPPTARRTGVARFLLESVSAEARSHGLKSLQLEVVPTQEAAFALYDSLGFSRVNRQRLDLRL